MSWFKNLILKIAAKYAARKLDLKEGPLKDKKSWWKSKTVLSAIVVVIVGMWELVQANLGPQFGFTLPDIPNWVLTLLGAIGIYGRVSADKKIG